MDLVGWSELPHGWTKLEYLGASRATRATRGVMNAILRPSHHVAEVVGSGCKAVISTRKIGKSSHLTQALFPNVPVLDQADTVGRTVYSEATPPLPYRLR